LKVFDELPAIIDEAHPIVIKGVLHDDIPEYHDASDQRPVLFFDGKTIPYELCIFQIEYQFIVVRNDGGRADIAIFYDDETWSNPRFAMAMSAHTIRPRVPAPWILSSDYKQQVSDEAFAQMTSHMMWIVRDLCCYVNDELSSDNTSLDGDVVTYPDSVQKSRAKHHKKPLPAIRILHLRKPSENIGRKHQSHSSPDPHDRRGHWCKSKLGKVYWRKSSKVLGGRKEPVINIITKGTSS